MLSVGITSIITEVDLSFRVRPVLETVMAAHAVEIESNHLNIGWSKWDECEPHGRMTVSLPIWPHFLAANALRSSPMAFAPDWRRLPYQVGRSENLQPRSRRWLSFKSYSFGHTLAHFSRFGGS